MVSKACGAFAPKTTNVSPDPSGRTLMMDDCRGLCAMYVCHTCPSCILSSPPLSNQLAAPQTLGAESTKVQVVSRCFKRTPPAPSSSGSYREIGLFGGLEGGPSTK